VAYLVGVDSGGTHTNIRIHRPDGTHKMVPEIDRSLTSNRPDEELRSILDEIFTAVSVHTLGERAFVWVSAAGYANSTREQLVKLLQASMPHTGGRIGICNDAVTLLLAHQEETIIVVAGTGSAAMAKSTTGNVVTRGGDEWVAADYGSAFWIGLSGIRAAYQAIEGGADTALKRCLTEHYRPLKSQDTRNTPLVVREIVRRLAALGTDTKPVIASFAREVTRQAELGDDVAQTIVRQAVDELAAIAARVYRELAEQARPRAVTPHFLLSGSVASRSPFYAETFRASLNQFLFDVRQSSDHAVDLTVQLNGTLEAVELARRLAADESIAELDEYHSYSILDQ